MKIRAIAVYLNKLGIALHQQTALGAGAEILRAGHESRSDVRRRAEQYWHDLVPAQEIWESHQVLPEGHRDPQRHAGAVQQPGLRVFWR